MRPLLRRFPALGGLQLFGLLAATMFAVTAANQTILIVTNTNDSGPGSLRQALADANNGDTIQFDPALNGQAVSLTSGELAIDKNITITGPGPNLLAITQSSVNNPIRVFHVMPGHTVIMEGLTIRDSAGILNGAGNLSIINCTIRSNHLTCCSTSSAIYNDGSGGNATLTILDSTVTGNDAAVGGGIYNNGLNATLSLQNSSVDNNLAEYVVFPHSHAGYGGGIYNAAGHATITNCSVSNNTAAYSDGVYAAGGGIYNTGILTIINSTIHNNQCPAGGGIANNATLTITGSTVSSNVANGFGDIFPPPIGDGGGILNNGMLTISNSTISSNTAHHSGGGISGGGSISNSTISDNAAGQLNGGGIYISGSLEIGNTILKTGTSGANIVDNGGTVTSYGYNISNDNGAGFLTGPGDQINTDPMLGPLQNNGGPTFTHDLLAGSPALDAGNPSFTQPPSTDQRGYARVFNGRIDIGSLEVQPTPPSITISGTISYCSNPVPGPVPNVTVTLTGSSSGLTLSNSSGNYQFSSLPSGGNYTVTPSKSTRLPGSAGIDTVDVVATQRHFLNLGTPLSGCRLTAADVNGDSAVNTIDVVAIQRFFLGSSTGIANVGKYQFIPASRNYPGVVSDQTGQNYDTLVFGDVTSPFVE
jgi:hypothetical protein